jgi:hypothetical protein
VLSIENTNFSGNGSKDVWKLSSGAAWSASTLIRVYKSELTLTGGKFTDNKAVFLITLSDAKANVDGADFTGNDCCTLYVRAASAAPSTFNNCKFDAGSAYSLFKYDFQFNGDQSNVVFVDSDFGDATFSDKNAATFVDCDVSNNVGSIFGEGSLTMIVAILALVASAVSIFLVADTRKKLVFATANKTAETEAEDEE